MKFNLIHVLIILGMLACALAILTKEASASQARLVAIKAVEGLHERKHRKQIKRIVGVNPAATPWCGYAVAYAVKRAGGTPVKGYPKAISWTRFGKPVSLSQARKGDIVVIRTRRGHHVTVYSKRLSKARFEGCGGNQSNQFKCSGYRVANVKAVRR